jgi:hypothetical protein
MSTKIQKLKNAWNEFLMGLANNKVLKGAVDILTNIIETINKMVGGIKGGLGDGIKTITSLLLAVGSIKIGKTLLGGGIEWIG